jgi:hypothetical protein
LLIAAVFTTYMTLMTVLGAYIYRTGQHRPGDPPGSDDGEPELMPVAA